MADPIAQFNAWFDEAVRGNVPEPTAMALATADAQGNPAVRIVLLKHADERGFVFYTNLKSAKAADLDANPRAALCFYWNQIGRQVRINGRTEPVSDAEADAYFATRPRLSQLGAWASKQSQRMSGYLELERSCAAYAVRYALGSVPRPPFWSGYRVVPDRLEFWCQKNFRRHERLLYIYEAGQWNRHWLFP
ncbi:MAG: pyridoxamine 5'-phosphate oxidase [Verrucomicrobiota bacterium]|nr:pyridoxamine 5'-phosphate oxidase [Verrucomicrobiota bacterium]